MTPAAGADKQSDTVPVMMPATVQLQSSMVSESFAKDAIIAWFRGEFAAANAIIDSLCNHLTQLEGGAASQYESVFAAIHRRRLNWIPVLQMQKYYSIADVTNELRRVIAARKVQDSVEDGGGDAKKIEEMKISVEEKEKEKEEEEEKEKVPEVFQDESVESNENGAAGDVVDENPSTPKSEITDTGSQEVQNMPENVELCVNHEECQTRTDQMKMTKGFVAKESVKGHMVNVVKGLKLYEDILTDVEISKLTDFVNELRVAGQKGELSGETFILYNKQTKGNKRELIQLGAPIFGQIKEEATGENQKSHIEPIPALLEGVIDHLIQWHLVSEHRRPNGCIINFFDEGEYSQPFLKPPHLDQPILTVLLSESTMAFGHTIVNDGDGNYRGPLILSLKEGSLLVMRGNSADMARHVMCASSRKRVSITFFKVRAQPNESSLSAMPPLARAMTLWQASVPTPYAQLNGVLNGYEASESIPKWGVLRAPVVMLAPVRPMAMSPKRIPRDGTGVFLPWTVGSRRPAKHLPPRAQRGRLLALPPPVETHKPDPNSGPRSRHQR